jgi:signal transduction histidine kinase/HPt (histidine-containing phosphotransfer) domain-containing protein
MSHHEIAWSSFAPTLPMPAAVVDRYGSICEANPAWRNLFAYADLENLLSGAERWLPLSHSISGVLIPLKVPSTQLETVECWVWPLAEAHQWGVILMDATPQMKLIRDIEMSSQAALEEREALLVQGKDVLERERHQSIKIQNEVQKAKNAFFARMGHELRTPLNAILGLNHLLSQHCGTSEAHELNAKVERSARALMQMVNDVLSYTRIEAGDVNSVVQDFHLDRLLERVLGDHMPTAQEKGLELSLQIGPEVPRVFRGDSPKIMEIVGHLVSNAVKYTRKGEISVNVDLIAQLDRKVELRFRVRDTGPGVPEDMRSHLFQAFASGGTIETQGSWSGMGLGLALSYVLSETIGAKLSLLSTGSEGSVFGLEIQLEIAESSPPRKDMRIAVIDGDPVTLRVIMHSLEQFGATGVGFTSATEWLKTCQNGALWDLAVFEHRLPEGDVMEWVPRYLFPFSGPMPRLVLVTGSIENEERALGLGFHGCMLKPLKIKQLQSVLASVMRIKMLGEYEPLSPVPLSAMLLKRVQVSFAERYSHFPDRFLAMLTNGDLASARRDAHTFKGLAGTIGALRLQHVAGRMQSCLDEQDVDSAKGWLQLLKLHLEEVLELIGPVEVAIPHEHTSTLSPENWERLKLLVQKLKDFDPGAIELKEEMSEALSSWVSEDSWNRFARCIQSYNFEEAVGIAEAWLQWQTVEKP